MSEGIRIAVIGANSAREFTSAWLAAATLRSRCADPNVTICLFADAPTDIEHAVVFPESILPLFPVPISGSAYSVDEFIDWLAADKTFRLSEGDYGVSAQGAGFHQWFASAPTQTRGSYDEYSLAAVCAQRNIDNAVPLGSTSIFCTLTHGMSLSLPALIKQLRDYLHQCPNNVTVGSRELTDSVASDFDFIVDCRESHTDYDENWQAHFDTSSDALYASRNAQTHGQLRQFSGHPKRWRVSTHTDELITDESFNAFNTGDAPACVVKDAWTGNVIRIGASAMRIPMPLSEYLSMVLVDIQHWVGYALRKHQHSKIQTVFNKQQYARHTWRRDYWSYLQSARHCAQEVSLSVQFQHRLALFKKRGELSQVEDDPLLASQWIATFMCLDCVPQYPDVITSQNDGVLATQMLARLKQQIDAALQEVTTHAR